MSGLLVVKCGYPNTALIVTLLTFHDGRVSLPEGEEWVSPKLFHHLQHTEGHLTEVPLSGIVVDTCLNIKAWRI